MPAPALPLPEWLKERLLAQRTDYSQAYGLALRQGYLELPDWAYHLRDAQGSSLLDHAEDLQRLFDLVCEAAAQQLDLRIRIVGGLKRGEHYVLCMGGVIGEALVRLELSERYAWAPDPER